MFLQHIEQAFGTAGDERILTFLREQELADCIGDTARWASLFAKNDVWRREYLVWETETSIHGVDGWYLSLSAAQLRLPDGENIDWTTYLYRMTLLLVLSGMDEAERASLLQKGDRYGNLEVIASDFYTSGGCTVLTIKECLDKLHALRQASWQRYQPSEGHTPDYAREMVKNYGQFDEALAYLSQQPQISEVVRLNDFGGDDSVWYFAFAPSYLYLLCLSDAL